MRKRTHLFVLFLLFYTAVLHAQPPAIQWQQTYGGNGADQAEAIDTTSDHGYIVAGYTTSDDNGEVTNYDFDYDAWIVKLDSTGKIQWESAYGGSENDIAFDIHQTKDGGYIAAGFSESGDGSLTEAGGHGEADFWVFKLSSQGKLLWSKEYGGTADDEALSIRQTSDEGYIVAGETFSTNISGEHGGEDALVIKIDSVGKVKWEEPYGGSGNDLATSVIQLPNNTYMVAGSEASTDGQTTGNRGFSDYWVLHLNQKGVLLSQKTYGGSGSDNAYAITSAGNDKFYVAGESNSSDGQITESHGNGDYWIIDINSKDSLLWEKDYGGSMYDQPSAVATTTDGGCLVTGMTSSTNGNVTGNHGNYDVWAVKLSSTGSLMWEDAFGGTATDEGFVGKETRDGGYILAGITASTNGDVTSNFGGNSDYWVVKLEGPLAGKEKVTTSVESKVTISEKNQFSLYPNPNRGSATIKFNTEETGAKSVMIRYINTLGQTVFERAFPLQNGHLIATIQTSQQLPSGLYFVTATSGTTPSTAYMMVQQ